MASNCCCEAIDKQDCSVVSGPDIVSRGFVYVREADLMENAKEKVDCP